MKSNWSRLEKVIKSTGLSTNSFASSIGLKRSENLYRIKNGKNAISKELADMITIKYCNISKAWLLTGEGTMYINRDKVEKNNNDKTRKIPYYDSIVFDSDNKSNIVLPAPLYYIEVPTLASCDIAVQFVGESMSPEISSGSIVTLKELDISLILPGEIYMVITDRYTTIKYIRVVPGNDSLLRLVPRNKELYDEMVIEKSLIRQLYLVKGVISAKVL